MLMKIPTMGDSADAKRNTCSGNNMTRWRTQAERQAVEHCLALNVCRHTFPFLGWLWAIIRASSVKEYAVDILFLRCAGAGDSGHRSLRPGNLLGGLYDHHN